MAVKHATNQDGIPLIGIPASSTEEECDCCHNILHLFYVKLIWKQFLCPKCRRGDPLNF